MFDDQTGLLHYYKRQDGANSLGFIDIRATRSIESEDPELKRFKLVLPTRTWHLATGDQDLTIRWMDELHVRKSIYAAKFVAAQQHTGPEREGSGTGPGDVGGSNVGNEAAVSSLENDDEDAEDLYDGVGTLPSPSTVELAEKFGNLSNWGSAALSNSAASGLSSIARSQGDASVTEGNPHSLGVTEMSLSDGAVPATSITSAAARDGLDAGDAQTLVAERDFLRQRLALCEEQLRKKGDVVHLLQDELASCDHELALKDDVIAHLQTLLETEKQARAKEVHTHTHTQIDRHTHRHTRSLTHSLTRSFFRSPFCISLLSSWTFFFLTPPLYRRCN